MREGLEAFDSKMGQISEKMEELIKLERQARDLVNLLKNEMVKDVQKVKLPGVTITETPSGGCFAVVKFGELKLDNWSPRTYIPKEQAKAVVEELENCTTVDGICKRVGKMLEKGFIGDSTNDRVYLNDYTLKAIQNSDIGVYVTAHNYAEKKPNAYCVTFKRGNGLYEAEFTGKTTSEVSDTFAKTFPDASIMSIKCVKRGH